MSRREKSGWGFNTRFVIGKQDNPMMERWRLIQTPWFGIYVHFIYREDMDPVPHDHPWNFWRMVLKGGYIEEYATDPASGVLRPSILVPWRLHWFPVSHAHRITLVKPGTVSLVLVGRKRRIWGFWKPVMMGRITSPETLVGVPYYRSVWVDYRDALGLRPNEGVSG